MISKGQIYESCDPRDSGRQIRIESYTSGHARANIVSHPSGKRFRSILVADLHQTRLTGTGDLRKRGYFFAGMHLDSLIEEESEEK